MVNPLDYINRIIVELLIKIRKNNIRNNCHFLLRSHDKYRVICFVRLRCILIVRISNVSIFIFLRVLQIDIRKLQLAKIKIRTDESTARNDSVGERWNENGEGIEGGRDPRVES